LDRISGTTHRPGHRSAVLTVPAGIAGPRDAPAIAEPISGDAADDVLMTHETVDAALGAVPRAPSSGAPDRATISSASLPATLLVSISGEWDVANADQLADALDEGIEQAVPLLVVDLSAVTFLDVRAVSCLRQAADRLAAQGRRLAVVAAPPAVERIFDLIDGNSALSRNDSLVVARTASGEVLLTKRQREILGLIDDGLSTKEIAQRLWISPATVRNHVSAVLTALEVHTRLQAVRRGRELGFLPGALGRIQTDRMWNGTSDEDGPGLPASRFDHAS
jgi:anti-anti-sigma factor